MNNFKSVVNINLKLHLIPFLLLKPLVSIIIPTYNRARILGETLDSILGQTFSYWECIVVDDNSGDHTEELMSFYFEKDGRIRYFKRPSDLPKGANSCRNYGFEVSMGSYINWFDSDDMMEPNFIQKKFESFASNIKLVICSGYYVSENLSDPEKMNMNDDPDLFKSFVLWKKHIITNSVMFRRSFLEDKDLFLENITRGQEAEFFSRLFFKLNSTEYRIIDKPLFLYRQHGDTKTAKNLEYINDYKASQSYISHENLKRSMKIGDKKLINYLYCDLLQFYFQGLEHEDYKNSRNILIKLIPRVWKLNKKLAIELILFGSKMILQRDSDLEHKVRLNRNVLK